MHKRSTLSTQPPSTIAPPPPGRGVTAFVPGLAPSLRLLARPAHQEHLCPSAQGQGGGAWRPQSVRPAHLARPHGGSRGPLGLSRSPPRQAPWALSVAQPFHPVTHVGEHLSSWGLARGHPAGEHRLIKDLLSAAALAPGPWPPAQAAGPHSHFMPPPGLGDAAQADGIPRGSLGHRA